MPRKELTEAEKKLARELSRELADKTRESLKNPSDAVLGKRILEIRERIHELGFEIRCSRIYDISLTNPNEVELEVIVTLDFPLPAN